MKKTERPYYEKPHVLRQNIWIVTWNGFLPLLSHHEGLKMAVHVWSGESIIYSKHQLLMMRHDFFLCFVIPDGHKNKHQKHWTSITENMRKDTISEHLEALLWQLVLMLWLMLGMQRHVMFVSVCPLRGCKCRRARSCGPDRGSNDQKCVCGLQ